MLDTAADPVAGPVATPVAPPGTPRSARRVLVWVRGAFAVLLPTALAAAHASLYGRWEVDDAGITFAYARSVATGAGPVLQPGLPPVEGYSDLAWLALLALGRKLNLFDHGTWFGVPDYVAYPKTLALLLLAVVFCTFLAAASSVSRHPATVTAVAGCTCAVIPSFVIWSVSGLENSLLAATVAVQAAVLVRERHRLAGVMPAIACGLLAALAALTRPEGVVYAAVYPIALMLVGRGWWRSVGAGALSILAFAVPFGAYLAYRLATFGQWLPTTAIAKSQGLPTVAGFAKVGGLFGYAGWPIVLVGAVLVGAALTRSRSAGSFGGVGSSAASALPAPGRGGVGEAVALVLVPLALALVAFGILIPDWMEQYRFATPVWTLAPFAIALAADEVVAALRWRGRPRCRSQASSPTSRPSGPPRPPRCA